MSVWVIRMPVVPASATVTIVKGSASVPVPVGPVWLTGVYPAGGEMPVAAGP